MSKTDFRDALRRHQLVARSRVRRKPDRKSSLIASSALVLLSGIPLAAQGLPPSSHSGDAAWTLNGQGTWDLTASWSHARSSSRESRRLRSHTDPTFTWNGSVSDLW